MLLLFCLFCKVNVHGNYFQRFGLSALHENKIPLFALEDNPAYFGSTTNNFSLGVRTSTLFIKENSSYSIAGAWTKKKSNFFTSYQYIGFALFHRQKIAGGYTQKISNSFKIGSQFIYENAQIPLEKFSTHHLKLQLGICYAITPQFTGGSSCSYPISSTASTFYQDKEINIRQTFAYLFQKGFSTEIDLYKDLRLPLQWKIGLQYKVYRSLEIRTSAGFSPNTNSIGFSYIGAQLQISLDISYQAVLGSASALSLIWTYGNKSKH